MPEILTESFCERCGSRYTFEAVTPRARPLTKLKILARGLRTYVLSDETTLDEALAAARSEEQRQISAQQLEAFHRTFNFCMSCRQYTCGNCWNEVEGRCLTCAPNLGAEQAAEVAPLLPAAVPGPSGLPGGVLDAPAGGGNGHTAPTIDASAWPTVDLRREPAARGGSPDAPPELPPAPAGPVVETTAAAVEEPASAPDSRRGAAPEPAATDGPAPAVQLAAAVEPGPPTSPPSPEPATAAPAEASDIPAPPSVPVAPATTTGEQASAAIARTRWLLGRFRPHRPEGERAAMPTTEPAVEPAAAAAATPEPVVQPAAAAAATEPTSAAPPSLSATEPMEAAPPAPEPPPSPLAQPAPAPPATEAGVVAHPPPDRVETPVWQIVAPDTTPQAEPTGRSPVAWPALTARPAASPSFAPPPPAAADVVWAASSRDVLNRPGSGVQACVSCGLPLSATARFCRRCGTRQS